MYSIVPSANSDSFTSSFPCARLFEGYKKKWDIHGPCRREANILIGLEGGTMREGL